MASWKSSLKPNKNLHIQTHTIYFSTQKSVPAQVTANRLRHITFRLAMPKIFTLLIFFIVVVFFLQFPPKNRLDGLFVDFQWTSFDLYKLEELKADSHYYVSSSLVLLLLLFHYFSVALTLLWNLYHSHMYVRCSYSLCTLIIPAFSIEATK